MTDLQKAKEYLKPGAIVPVDIPTTALLVNALRQALANEALDKMAENARELGIQMQPEEPRAWFTVDELNAWADKKLKENPQWAEQPAQQDPVGKVNELFDEAVIEQCGFDRELLVYTSPPAQRTWVGLTDEEVKAIFDSVPTASCQSYAHWRSLVALAIENKLREKNT